VYRGGHERKTLESIEEWIGNTLFWLPLLISCIGLLLGEFTSTSNSLLSGVSMFVCPAIIVAGWLLTGRLREGYRKRLARLIEAILGIGAVLIVGLGVGVENGAAIGLAVGLSIASIGPLESNIKTGCPLWIARACFLIMVCSYAFLIWFFLASSELR
jgi:hypothetical protein